MSSAAVRLLLRNDIVDTLGSYNTQRTSFSTQSPDNDMRIRSFRGIPVVQSFPTISLSRDRMNTAEILDFVYALIRVEIIPLLQFEV